MQFRLTKSGVKLHLNSNALTFKIIMEAIRRYLVNKGPSGVFNHGFVVRLHREQLRRER